MIQVPLALPDADPFRACRCCDHERLGRCVHPEVRALVPVARIKGGACGPDAKWLTLNGDTLCPTTPPRSTF